MNIGKYLATLKGQLNPSETMSLESYLIEIVLKLIATGQSAEITQLQALASAAGDTEEASFFSNLVQLGNGVSTDVEVSGAGYQSASDVNSAISTATSPLDSRITALEEAPPSSGGGAELSAESVMPEDFIDDIALTGVWQTSVTGACLVSNGPSVGVASGHPGVVVFDATTEPSGVMTLSHITTLPFIFGGGTSYIGEWLINIEAPSDLISTYRIALGFSDQADAYSLTYGAIFYFDNSSPNWIATTINTADSEIDSNTGVAVSPGWVKLRIEANAAGTSVVFKINGTVVATHTTGIPTNEAERFGVAMSITKSQGLSRKTMWDYSYIKQTFETPR